MKVSLSWLKKYVSVKMNLSDIVYSLTMLGLEVESVVDRFDYLKKIIVGQITKIQQHPKSRELLLCSVNCGIDSVTIVCSAQNLNVGALVPVALNGVTMYNGETISQRKILGKISSGMMCSEKDLGISNNHNGVMLLNDTITIGSALKDVLAMSDFVLDIALTPNRSDCSSIIGIAREIAAVQKTELKLSFNERFNNHLSNLNTNNFISINIIPSKECPSYSIMLIEGVEIVPSPFWLKDRLRSVGVKPINNIVDVTNFVMFETGQPLHAFDFDLISGHKINVDISKKGENLETIDNKNLILPEGVLTIYDDEKPVSVAGVIGGINSKISDKTSRVLIESAYFNPSSIRKSSKMLGISTESSYRFERGVDPQGAFKGLERAATLISTRLLPKCKVVNFVNKNQMPTISRDVIIELCVNKTNKLLGASLSSDQISFMLNSVGFSNKKLVKSKKLKVKIPSFRIDVKRSEDLIEEVARLYGYNNIATTFPSITYSKSSNFGIQNRIDVRNKIRSVLNGIGFSEIINYSFTNINSCDHLMLPKNDYRRRQVSILNPISSVYSMMRTSLIPPILLTVNKNISRQIKNLMVFELGNIFISNNKQELPNEIEMLTVLWTGERAQPFWCDREQNCDFFDIKGALEELLLSFKIANFSFKILANSLCFYMRKNNAAQIIVDDNVMLGLVGELSSKLLESYSIKQKVFIFEIDVKTLTQCIPNNLFVGSIPKFPYISRDATIIVNEKIPSSYFIDRIIDMKETLVEDVYLVNIFEGSSNDDQYGMKNISFRIIYRSHNATLDDKTVNELHKLIIDRLVNEFEIMLPS